MPDGEKIKLGIETQKAFAKFHKVDEDTLTRWKKRPDYEERVDAILKEWSIGKTPAVIHAIYRAAVKGNPMSQMLWLQYFKGFNPKKDAEKEKPKVVISVHDIRHLIEQLPEPLKTKHYANLRDLLIDARAEGERRGTDDRSWNERPAGTIQGETDITPHDVPGKEKNDVAKSYPWSLRAHMVWQVHSRYHQGAERRWEE